MSINLNCTVEKLNFYFSQVEVSESFKQLTNVFEKNPILPGVILVENSQLVGLISRTSFLQYMSRPYSWEIADRRSIKSLLNFLKVQNFIIPKNTLIIEAAQKSLQRSSELMNEPIIVETAPERYGMIDAHELLVYHAKIQEYTRELLTQMYGEIEKANQKLEKANQKLKYLSRVDDLTQVANRRSFNQYLQREWQRGQEQKMPLAVILFAIDYFTEYNNQYGALAGDSCLQSIAENVSNFFVENTENLLARYDGSTFAIVMPNNNAIAAAGLAENIRNHIIKLGIEHSKSQISDRLTLSIGVASILPTKNNSFKSLTLAASLALDRAKQEGRNRKIIWHNSEAILDDSTVTNLAI